jgi:hypothetical protein
MLKFFELEGRFPQFVEEFPQAAVDYVADVVKVLAEDLAKYDLSSRSANGDWGTGMTRQRSAVPSRRGSPSGHGGLGAAM